MTKGKIIFTQSTNNSEITVYENRKLRWLTFDNRYIQTLINKKKPWVPMLCYLKALCAVTTEDASRLLVLGTGGGAILHYLQHHYPKASIEAVEINPTAIHVAHEYFGIKTPIIEDCALNQLKKNHHYTHVYIDIFTDENTLQTSLISDILTACQQCHTNTVSMNILFEKTHDAFEFISRAREKFDQKTLCLMTEGSQNIVFHAFKTGDYLENLTHLYKNKVIKKPQWDQDIGAMSTLYR